VTPPDTSVTPNRPLEVDLDLDVDVVQGNTSVVTDAEPEPAKRRKRRKALPVASDDVQRCFDWYCDLFGKTGKASLLLTSERADAIEWALDTFGKAKVAECLKGYHSDPWRREQLTRHEVATLLRDEKHVEAGIHMAIEAANKGASAADSERAAFVASLGGAA
jgi:hypothetical protein